MSDDLKWRPARRVEADVPTGSRHSAGGRRAFGTRRAVGRPSPLPFEGLNTPTPRSGKVPSLVPFTLIAMLEECLDHFEKNIHLFQKKNKLKNDAYKCAIFLFFSFFELFVFFSTPIVWGKGKGGEGGGGRCRKSFQQQIGGLITPAARRVPNARRPPAECRLPVGRPPSANCPSAARRVPTARRDISLNSTRKPPFQVIRHSQCTSRRDLSF